MIYRCDIQHFLVHAIDYFTLPDLMNFQYALVTSKLSSGGRSRNVAKLNILYPDIDTVIEYDDYKDKEILRKRYFDMLEPADGDKTFQYTIYKTFINPLMEHYNVMIVCDEIENDYIDVLCDYLKEKFEIEVIDLNILFSKGRIGSIYIDRDEIHDKAVDIRRSALKEQIKSMASTRDGKEILIGKMSKKEKIKQLKKYGIKVTPNDKDIDALLLEEWCADDNTSDD